MKIVIRKYPEFISVRPEGEGSFDKRVRTVRPGEELVLHDLTLSYTQLQIGPPVINLDVSEQQR